MIVFLLILAGIYYSWFKNEPIGDLLFAVAMGVACVGSFASGHTGWGIVHGALAVLCYCVYNDKTKKIDD